MIQIRDVFKTIGVVVADAFCAFVLFSLVKDWEWDVIHVFWFIIMGAPFIAAFVIAIKSLYDIIKQKWRILNSPLCVHGVRGGAIIDSKTNQMRCAQCQKAATWKSEVIERIKQVKEERDKKYKESIRAAIILREKATFNLVDELYRMSPQDFEDLVASLFKKMGFEVKQTPYSNDGGKDAVLRKEGAKYYLECKKYKPSKKIGRREIQFLAGVMSNDRVSKGYYVTTSHFTKTAVVEAKKTSIHLIDIEDLTDLLDQFIIKDAPGDYTLSCPICGGDVSFKLFDDMEFKLCAKNHRVNNIFWNVYLNEPICPECGRKLIKKDAKASDAQESIKQNHAGLRYICSNQKCEYSITEEAYIDQRKHVRNIVMR